MQNYFSLLKILLINTFRRIKGNKGFSKHSMWLIPLLICVGVLPLLSVVCFAVYVYGQEAVQMGITNQFFTFMLTMGQFGIMFLGAASILSYMFFSRDAEFLQSLPIKRSTLYIAKFTMVYLSELIIAIALLPTLIVYGISVGALAIYYVMLPIVILTLPLIPLLIVSILAFPLMYVVSFFKKRRALSLIVLIVLFVSIMGMYFAFLNSFSNSGGEINVGITNAFVAFMDTCGKIMLPNRLLADALLDNLGVWNFIIKLLGFLGLIGAISFVSTYIASLFYQKGVMAQTESSQDNVGSGFVAEAHNIEQSYLVKDFKQLIRNTGFAFQSFGVMFLAPILIAFMSQSLAAGALDELVAFGGDWQIDLVLNAIILFYSLLFCCGINYTASSAFTREGANFYINKYLPVDPQIILRAKLKFANIVTVISIILVLAVLLVMQILPPLNILLSGIFMMALGLGMNSIAIKRDLKRPKLDWNNVNEALKNNIYMMVPMFITMALGAAIIALGFIVMSFIAEMYVAYMVFWFVCFVTAGILFYISDRIVYKDTKELFERIEA